jgi:hypothetical protein
MCERGFGALQKTKNKARQTRCGRLNLPAPSVALVRQTQSPVVQAQIRLHLCVIKSFGNWELKSFVMFP